jgi:hypothetical protein
MTGTNDVEILDSKIILFESLGYSSNSLAGHSEMKSTIGMTTSLHV